MQAVGCVFEDDGFNIQSPLAAEAVQTAMEVLGWCSCSGNREEIESFVTCIYEKLQVSAWKRPIQKKGKDVEKLPYYALLR